MPLTKQEREQGYRETPRPPGWAEPILRRIAGGYLIVTLDEDGSYATYDNGKEIWMPVTQNGAQRTKQMDLDTVKAWVKRGWLIPIKDESLFEDGPPQRYRTRTIADGILPRVVDKFGQPHWLLGSSR